MSLMLHVCVLYGSRKDRKQDVYNIVVSVVMQISQVMLFHCHSACLERPEVYLERTIFPVLMEGLEALLRTAKQTEVSPTHSGIPAIQLLAYVCSLLTFAEKKVF